MKKVKQSMYAPLAVAGFAMIVSYGCAMGAFDNGDPQSGSDLGVQADAGTQDDGAIETDGGGAADAGSVADGGTVDDAGTPVLDRFSFFVTSLAALRDLSKSQNGFGGDLRYGETGAGAGLRGADKICAEIAERSMPGSSVKQWRAFLSVAADGNGKQVNAIDRIGDGPWYDRLGRLLAPDKASVLNQRPIGGDSTIKNDFPNEDGVPNHRPDPTQPEVDNHDMLTGTNAEGKLYSSTATCKDWTAKAGTSDEGRPRVGHSWPRSGGPGPGAGGMDDMANWMSALDESGCKPGVNLVETGAPDPRAKTVGSGGGYGGFYCFALIP
ncbi:MAG: hypothetical protein WC889_11560 [Myxococcota bacterium]